MTVSTTLNKQIFQGNAATTAFSFSFAFPGGTATQEGANIQVFYTSPLGVVTQLVQGITSSNYQIVFNSPVSPDPTPVGGTVTYNPPTGPIPLGSFLTIYRNLPLTQITSFANQATIYPTSFEQSLDYQAMVSQQVLEVQSRALVVAVSDPTPNPLPPVAARAGLLLGFDSNGNPIATSGSGGGGGAVSSWNGRTGAVFPQAADYSFAQISGNVTVSQMAGGAGAAANTFWNGSGVWAQVNFNQLAGSIAVAQMNSGALASTTTFWRGDGTWASSLSGGLTLGANGGVAGSLQFNGSTSGSFIISASALGTPQYPGTTTNDNAPTGDIGEYISSSIASGSAVSLSTGTPANITSISLTAGDWDVWASFYFITGASTVFNNAQSSISLGSAALDTTNGRFNYFNAQALTGQYPSGFPASITVGPIRLPLSGSTTVFMVAQGSFTTSTLVGYGILQARRRR